MKIDGAAASSSGLEMEMESDGNRASCHCSYLLFLIRGLLRFNWNEFQSAPYTWIQGRGCSKTLIGFREVMLFIGFQ